MTSEAYEDFRELLERNSTTEAIELAERQLVEAGGVDEFWLTQLSRAHLRAQHRWQALEYANRALEQAPNNGFALVARGKAHRSLKNYDRAVSDFEEGLSMKRVVKQSRWGLVTTLTRMERWEELINRLNEWEFPEEQLLRWRLKAYAGLEQYDQARDTAKRLLEIEPDDPRTLWELVDVEIEQEGLESVKERYARLARIPSRPRIYREIYASLCRRAGDEETAAEQYAQLQKEDADPSIQRRRAFTLAKTDREEEAIPLMEELLRQSPNDHYVHNAYKAACERVGELERVWSFYGELLRIHPDEKSLYGRRKKIAKQLEEDPESRED